MTGEELHALEKKIAADGHPTMLFGGNWEQLSDDVQKFYNEKAERLTNWNLSSRIASLSVNEKQEIYEQLHREGCRIYK